LIAGEPPNWTSLRRTFLAIRRSVGDALAYVNQVISLRSAASVSASAAGLSVRMR